MAELGRICPVIERPNTFGAGTGITYHPDALKIAWERLVRAAGNALHAFVQDVVRSTRGLDALVVATKAGLQLVRGRGDCRRATPTSARSLVCRMNWPAPNRRRKRSRRRFAWPTSTCRGAKR